MSLHSSAIWVAAFAIVTFGGGLPPVIAGQKALLIGAGAYPHLEENYVLHGPQNDVRAMETFLLQEWGFPSSDIRILLDENATKAAILEALEIWLPDATGSGDRIVVYFSGHGTQVPDRNGDEPDGMDEAFLPNDYGRNGAHPEDMLIDDELAEAFDNLRGRQVLLVADSCHSGTVSRSVGSEVTAPLPNAKARYVPFGIGSRSIGVVRDEEPLSTEVSAHLTISAALPHQLAWEVGGYGLFTQYFIEGLTDLRADLNGNGRVTSAELINFIKPRTESWCDEVEECLKYRFTPNLFPRDETFVLQPASNIGSTVVGDGDADTISDVLPALGSDTLSVDIRPGNRVNIGEEVSFVVTSDVEGYLTLLDFNADNRLTLLFPTAEDIGRGKSGRILANRPLTIPDKSYGIAFRAVPPTGDGHLIAIVTEDRVDLDGLLDEYRSFEEVDNKLDFVKSIAERLYRVWTGDRENRGAAWAVSNTTYWIDE